MDNKRLSIIMFVIIPLIVVSLFVSYQISAGGNLEGIGTPVRSHQFISTVGLDNQTVWFCPVTDHGTWLCGNYSLAPNVEMLPSVHWYNQTNVLVDAYWDGTWYTGDDGNPYKHLVGIYGNRSSWVLDSWVYATLLNGEVIKLESG